MAIFVPHSSRAIVVYIVNDKINVNVKSETSYAGQTHHHHLHHHVQLTTALFIFEKRSAGVVYSVNDNININVECWMQLLRGDSSSLPDTLSLLAQKWEMT